jgi:hypothetical protein
MFAVGISGAFTKNGLLLSTTDPEVFTVIKPGVAKVGKIAVICPEFTKLVVAAVPLNDAMEAAVKPVPLIVIVEPPPLQALKGLKLDKLALLKTATAPDQ